VDKQDALPHGIFFCAIAAVAAPYTGSLTAAVSRGSEFVVDTSPFGAVLDVLRPSAATLVGWRISGPRRAGPLNGKPCRQGAAPKSHQRRQ